MNILQASSADTYGGAERIAWDLFKGYRARGHGSWLVVGRKYGADPDVFTLPNHQARNQWARFWESIELNLAQSPSSHLKRRLRHLSKGIGQPVRTLRVLQGREDFDYPATSSVLSLSPSMPDVLHCHNLHGGYFDLRSLPEISQNIPLVLTMHDAWLLSGHCAHSLDCDRWRTGCGYCPDLTLYPPVYRDATDANWQAKKEIYEQCRLYVATPSQWLMNKVEGSILTPAVEKRRVIANGVDLGRFRPADAAQARYELGLPPDMWIVLFIAHGVRQNRWKDYATMRQAVNILSERTDRPILFLAIGEDAPEEREGQCIHRFIPFQTDVGIIAKYLQAADIYLHLTFADTFPTTILEALACGTPVVASRTGGIPEQVQDHMTGFLVSPGDPAATAYFMQEILSNPEQRSRMSALAAATAQQRFDVNLQVEHYLEWYEEILADRLRIS